MTRSAVAVAVLSAAFIVALYSDAQEAPALVTYQITRIESVKKSGKEGLSLLPSRRPGSRSSCR